MMMMKMIYRFQRDGMLS